MNKEIKEKITYEIDYILPKWWFKGYRFEYYLYLGYLIKENGEYFKKMSGYSTVNLLQSDEYIREEIKYWAGKTKKNLIEWRKLVKLLQKQN